MSFNVVESSALILCLKMCIFLFIYFGVLIDMTSGRGILELELTTALGHLIENLLILMYILKTDHRQQVRTMIGNYQIH